MNQVELLETIEKFLRGEMSSQEKLEFEELRKTNAEVDQLAVEHGVFLHQLDKFGENKQLRTTLHDIHNDLVDKGHIKETTSRAVIRQLWKKHKRVMAVAASIAGITTMLIAGMVSYYSRKANTAELLQLSKKFENTERKVNALKQQVESDKVIEEKSPANIPVKSGGTGFLIDGRGFLVTNAHVVNGSSTVVVQNNKSQEFRAKIVHINEGNDIAILKIEDNDFKSFTHLPYGLKKSGAELGEQLFTLGYPREEIVYNEGYMSAKTGFNGDTITCQIGVQANPGNSGGPVFNKNGEIIAIINTRQARAEGVVFAINARNIITSVNALSKDKNAWPEKDSVTTIRLPHSSSLKGLDRVQQIKKIQDCVFMVKSY